MATGRIGVTPTLGVRWSKAPTGGTTALSGLDDSSVSLVYSVGYEQVYRNGVLLSRGNDYTATTGTTITLIDATITGDIIEVFAQQLVPLTDAISKGQFTAKGTLLSATAASTPGVLGVGANGTVLTAASGQATGLEWATPSSGGMTLISTTSLTGASVTLSSIPQTYNDLRLVIRDFYPATDNQTLQMTFNGDTGANYTFVRTRSTSTAVSENVTASNFPFNDRITQQDGTDSNARAIINIYDYATALDHLADGIFVYLDNAGNTPVTTFGLTYFPSTSAAITSITINVNSGNLGGGSVLLYGVK